MNNLVEIQGQIEKLQKQASDIKLREFDKTVQDILVKMKAFGITLKDLQASKVRVGKGKGKTKAVKTGATAGRAGAGVKKKKTFVVTAKYRGPNGETWSGRGLMPKWLAALVAAGQTREDFAIKS